MTEPPLEAKGDNPEVVLRQMFRENGNLIFCKKTLSHLFNEDIIVKVLGPKKGGGYRKKRTRIRTRKKRSMKKTKRSKKRTKRSRR